jgi:predicted amidophosphoribosyltransferase
LWLLLLSNPLIDPKTTIISHVPSHRRRKYIQKWYNQSEILAKTVAEYTSIQHYTLFEKVRHTKSQTKLKKAQRKTSLTNAFKYIETQVIPNKVKTLILVDDIVTTWSTLNILGILFKSYYPNIRVECLVVGRHMW